MTHCRSRFATLPTVFSLACLSWLWLTFSTLSESSLPLMRKAVFLSDLKKDLEQRESVNFDLLPGGVEVVVRTHNSRYEIRKPEDGKSGRALIKGGARFNDWSSVVIQGSTWGGTAIHNGHINCGMHLEVAHDGKRVTTSLVESIVVKQEPTHCHNHDSSQEEA